MQVDRRWYWFGAALLAAGVALASGVSLGTLLYAAALLACPAAMFFGMGMMGRAQGGQEAADVPRVQSRLEAGAPVPGLHESATRRPETGPVDPARGNPLQRGDPAGVNQGEDPMVILKRRLAAGDITIEEYERVRALISASGPAVSRT